MNYDFYKTFVVLAETKNFSKTAEKLNIVQSTVSNRVQELEKYLGIDLCYRTNKSVLLTQSGLWFLPYAKRIVAMEDESIRMLTSLKYKNTVRIGTVHSLYSSYLKKMVKKFMKLSPDTSLEVKISHTPNLLEMLSDGLIDIGLVSNLPKSNKFTCSHMLKDEIILTTKNHENYFSSISMSDVKNIPLLYADSGDNFIEHIENYLQCKLEFKFSIDQISEIVEYLEEGFGYAFVPKSLVNNAIKEGYLKEVSVKDAPQCNANAYVIIEKNNIKREILNSFLQLFLDNNITSLI
ncbi:DNA-binding transcriptional LysR family regulator [Clostridium punense]|uniref:DNA-binding transcriptional LysR family regulator n=1 Tax=Clostridium punense TaxID=1054297 RepID=A0ABS4K4E4_9CLOT|nr:MULTISPECIES: LysR family transcriptional regulator [Clostridium]EQB89882.1 hypothetical protein M918_18220 [Clostridium sp. BL8]MBP2022006.1 DNA-binding transcriptional LysR family regulator [Clostridium punense]